MILAQDKVIGDQNKVIGDQNNVIDDLRAEVTILQTRVTSFERASKRQAAPFRIEENKRKKDKKNPGNKLGHKGHFRKFSGIIDKTIEVPLVKCPICDHGEFKDVKPIEQSVRNSEVIHVNKVQQKCYSHHLKAISVALQFVADSEKDKALLKEIKSKGSHY